MIRTKPAALLRRAVPGRRAPVDWRLYAAQVHRGKRRLPRYEHPLAVSVAVSLVFTIAGILLLQLVGVGIGAGLKELGSSVVSSMPKQQEVELILGETPVNVSAAPILDGLPEFTRSNAVPIAGKIPAFAVKPGRAVIISVNGKSVGSFPVGTDGRFGGTPLTLADGTSVVQATLIEGATEIASTSATVVVDRVAPTLSITRPKAAETIEGTDVIVEGKTEAGADVSVNDRALRPNPDGTFTERITASPGPLALTIIARDKAGNETKAQITVTVKQSTLTTAAGTTLVAILDRTKVRPGETVVAKIVATEGGKPKADLAVTLQVGVFTVGTYKTDAAGTAIVGFAAPNHEVDDVAVVVLGGGASARVSLTVSAK